MTRFQTGEMSTELREGLEALKRFNQLFVPLKDLFYWVQHLYW